MNQQLQRFVPYDFNRVTKTQEMIFKKYSICLTMIKLARFR